MNLGKIEKHILKSLKRRVFVEISNPALFAHYWLTKMQFH